ncbi:MAG: HPr family phosphocarrier protein [Magnetococcales bacterium]|nr:HPr family phosphocarrier protein [Magnetococcales bacterium]
MPQREVTIINRLGMHTRAAAKFVKAAALYESEIRLIKGDIEVDGKSIISIMMLAAAKGDRVIIRAIGSDEQKALEDLSKLIGKKFGEDRKGR